jgi:Tfp pilus assembly protein PilF
MSNSLLNSLLAFYEEDPHDPFNIYALALEYLKSSSEQAEKLFDTLLHEHASYLPTYYHAADFFALKGDTKKAERIYMDGIALALTQKNIKTQQELQRAYRSFLDELEY